MPDEVALMNQLHEEHALALWRFCLRLVGNDEGRAEDVVQETMLRAWRHRAVLESSPPALRAWLYTVARNIVTDEWRRQRTRRETSVAEAITRLSADHRAVLLECYYRGQPVAEASRRLGVPEGTVKSRTHYALRALRLALEEMGVSAS